jgi:probable HAF family extracellular repeat protein
MRSLAWLVAIAAAVGLAASSCSVEEKPPVGKTSEVKPPAVAASEEKTPEVKAPGEKPFEVKSFLDIGTLGGVTGWAFDVNDCCAVTGWALNAAEQVRPFLWQEGKMTELPVPPDSGNVQAWRINNAGIICGQSNPGIGRHRALVWMRGYVVDIGTLGGTEAAANGVNNEGQVAGQARRLQDGAWHPFIWDSITGGMTTFEPLRGPLSAAGGINDLGHVTGNADGFDGRRHAFLWDGSVTIDLGAFGGKTMHGEAVNNHDQVVGWGEDTRGKKHAFLWEKGKLKDLGTLGGDEAQAFDINDAGQIVGWSLIDKKEWHAFLYEDGVMVDLTRCLPSDVKGYIQDGKGINAKGFIVGSVVIEGKTHAYILPPVDIKRLLNPKGSLKVARLEK